MAVHEAAIGRWFSVAEAAAELGVPERSIYRRIATQALRARRGEEGGLQVYLEEARPEPASSSSLKVPMERETVLTPERARALTEFANGLLSPLVARLAEQEAVIREQAAELGELRARGNVEDRLAPVFARQMAELAAIREEIEHFGKRRRWWPFW